MLGRLAIYGLTIGWLGALRGVWVLPIGNRPHALLGGLRRISGRHLWRLLAIATLRGLGLAIGLRCALLWRLAIAGRCARLLGLPIGLCRCGRRGICACLLRRRRGITYGLGRHRRYGRALPLWLGRRGL